MSEALKTMGESIGQAIISSARTSGSAPEIKETQEKLLHLKEELKGQLKQIKKCAEEQEEREKKNDSMLAMIWAKLQEKN